MKTKTIKRTLLHLPGSGDDQLTLLPLKSVLSRDAVVLMQYLEGVFIESPNGVAFYITPPKTQPVLFSAQNLVEELEMSAADIKKAFTEIGVSYASRESLRAGIDTGDIFQGKFYYRYFLRSGQRYHMTAFYRNHSRVEKAIKGITI